MWFCVPLTSLESGLVKQRIAWDFRRLEDVASMSKSGVDCWRRKDSAEQLGGDNRGEKREAGRLRWPAMGVHPYHLCVPSLGPQPYPQSRPNTQPNTHRVS